ncbi:MAG: glycosyl hydrolase family 18 protein [Pseudomonadota bacterium]
MPFSKSPNVAQYQNADWDNHVKTVSGTTVEAARRIAVMDPQITFFFYCRQAVALGQQGTFQAGDAVFFSGQSWPGEAPQCDVYTKEQLTVGYISSNDTDGDMLPASCFTLEQGGPAFDIVLYFATNLQYVSPQTHTLYGCNPAVQPCPDTPWYTQPNTQMQKALTASWNSNVVQQLQDQGSVVLMSVLGNWTDAGWSNFTTWEDAQAFAQSLNTNYIKGYGFDGIDIDDEYSAGTPNSTSLAMVTLAIRQAMPDKLLTIAAYSGSPLEQPQCWRTQYAPPNSDAPKRTAAQNIDYVWDMSYGTSVDASTYEGYGFSKNRIFWGVQGGYNSGSSVATQVQQESLGGVMFFTIDKTATQTQAGDAINTLFGAGSWQVTPGCLPDSWKQT